MLGYRLPGDEEVQLGDYLQDLESFPISAESVSPAPIVSESATKVQRTQLVKTSKGEVLLLVRAKFSWVWRNTGQALEEIGLIVDDKDRRTGIYDIFYPASGISGEQSKAQDRTLLERIGLTTGDAEQSHLHYQLKLKKEASGGVRITVLDHEGQWQSSKIAVHILTRLHNLLIY